MMDLERCDDGSIMARLAIGADIGAVTFRAENVRRERSTVHAKVIIAFNDTILGHSSINVEKHEDRVRLANHAHDHLGEVIAAAYPKKHLQHDLDMFTFNLWPVFLGNTASDLLYGDEAPSLPSFVIEPYAIANAGTILFAPPESGKSWTLLLWAVSVDAGICDPWPVRQSPVLFLNLERSSTSMSRRLARVNEALGLDPRRPLLFNNARGKSLADVIESVRRTVVEQGIGHVFVDSLSRTGYGSLIENEVANRIIDALNSLGVTWTAIAHSPREDSTHVFGSQMFDAGADIIVQQISERIEGSDTLGVGLRITKGNDIPRYPLQVLAYEFDRDYGLSAIRRARSFEFPEIEGTNKQSMKDAVKGYLLSVGSESATAIAQALGYNRQNVSTLLNKNGVFIPAGKRGKESLFAVRADVSPHDTSSVAPRQVGHVSSPDDI